MVCFAAESDTGSKSAASPASGSAATTTATTKVASTATIFTELQKLTSEPKSSRPLGGSFAEGEKMLRAANPENEANLVFNQRGQSAETAPSEKAASEKTYQLISICGFACLSPGATSEQSAQAAVTVAIPATSDALNEQNKGYNEIAQDFAARFNKQMLSRKFPDPKQPDHISKILPESELTINGVTIGKSNLYNSIGRFGTNAFHHEGDAGDSIYVVCWKGADGTKVAFESGELGGRDQTILEGRVLAAGADYRFEKYCKPSKKVDAKVALFGIHLGDAVTEVEKKNGVASVHEDERLIYRYEAERKHGKKKAVVVSEVEIAAKDNKVTQISVGKTETY